MERLDFKKLGSKALGLIKHAGELAAKRGIRVYLVGGAVRDLILGRPNLDLDIVVEGDGIAFARVLAETFGGKVLAHQRFGTAVLTLADGMKLDIVTARRESYSHPGALPDIFRGTLADDLFRRDFTINAIAVSIEPSDFGVLRDDQGGLTDLRKGVVRILHERSFIDDPTRILRAIRYEKRFGFRMSRETLAALKDAVSKDRLTTVTPVRYWNEFRRILEEDEPLAALERLSQLDALRFFKLDRNSMEIVRRVSVLAQNNRKVFLSPDVLTWRVYCAALVFGSEREEAVRLLNSVNVGRDDKRKIFEILQIAAVPVMLDRNCGGPKKDKVPVEALIFFAAAAPAEKMSKLIIEELITKG